VLLSVTNIRCFKTKACTVASTPQGPPCSTVNSIINKHETFTHTAHILDLQKYYNNSFSSSNTQNGSAGGWIAEGKAELAQNLISIHCSSYVPILKMLNGCTESLVVLKILDEAVA